jgi:hypothetical protein
VARWTCRSCEGALPRRGARCGTCGWAADYGTGVKRLERERLLGVAFIVGALSIAFALALAVGYLRGS